MSQEDAVATAFRAPDVASWLQPAAARLGLGAAAVDVTLHKVHHRPGVDVSAGFTVSDGTSEAYLVATTAAVPEGARVTQVGLEGHLVSIWRHPDDPYLPGLRAACDADVVSLWVDATSVEVTMSAYRPIRRAVLRYTAGNESWFAKVVRPARLADLADRQLVMSEASLSPALLGTPAPGTLLLAAADGTSLANALSMALAGRGPALDPLALIGLLDRLPVRAMSMKARPSWVDHLDFHARAAIAAQPKHKREIEDLAATAARIIDAEPASDPVPTHGDFYEANVFVVDGQPTSLIDLDALGPGLREDDLACLLGHLSVLPAVSPRHFGDIEPLVTQWAAVFEAHVPSAAALRARVAAVALSLVAGAGAERGPTRLAVARDWVARARERSTAR